MWWQPQNFGSHRDRSLRLTLRFLVRPLVGHVLGWSFLLLLQVVDVELFL